MNDVCAVKPIFRDKKRRVWELDFLRGFAVLAMCFDHAMWDFAYYRGFFSNGYEVENAFFSALSDFARGYMNSTSTFGFRFWAHYLFVFLFLFLVGTSCALSRDNTRRGALGGIAALAFTGISYACRAIGVMENGVVFGILHCIALSILCAAALNNLTFFDKRVNKYAPLAIGFSILLAGILMRFWNMAYNYDPVFTDQHFTGYVIGTHAYGDDWFGLFPYVGMVFIGMYWGKAAYSQKASLMPQLNGKWNKPFCFVGRHALIFYFLHQAVIAGLVIIIGMCCGYKV